MKSTHVRREREERRRAGYREVILHAAERVILRKGYSALTMDDVAREAQLSKATVYKYVAGKGGLLIEILGHSFDDIRERFAATVEGSGSAQEKLRRLVQVVLESGEDMKQINRVLWMDKAMLKLMRVFVAPLGKAGAPPPPTARSWTCSGRRGRSSPTWVPASSRRASRRASSGAWTRPRPGPSSRRCSRVTRTCASGKGTPPSPPERPKA